MFRFAQYIVRHKVGAVAVLALVVVFASPERDEQQDRPNNPWAVQAPQAEAEMVAEADTGFMDDMMEEANGLIETAGFGEAADEATATAERFDDTAAAFASAAPGT